ncbi:MAG TPA: hypothetical protein VFI74_00520 [Candidatus Saccharimonadales bacterium]|nr:hypothetical protein [Candidatus Saccharimonadales bacterium]
MIEALDPHLGGKDVVSQVVDGVLEAEHPHLPYMQVFAHDIVMQAVAGARRLEYTRGKGDAGLYEALNPNEIQEVQEMLGTTYDALSHFAASQPLLPTTRKLPGTLVMAPPNMKVTEQPPETYISSATLARRFDSHPRHIEMRLTEECPDELVAVRLGARQYELWHSPSTQERLSEKPPLKAIKPEEHLTLRELAYLLDIDPKRSKELPKRFPIVALSLCNEWGLEVASATHQDVAAALMEAVQTPFAHASDEILKALGEETDLAFARRALRKGGHAIRRKRVHPTKKVRQGMLADHVSKEQADEVREAFGEQSQLQYMTLSDIARAAGTSLSQVIRSLTAEEQNSFVPQHLVHGLGKANGIAKCLPKQIAHDVLWRLCNGQ